MGPHLLTSTLRSGKDKQMRTWFKVFVYFCAANAAMCLRGTRINPQSRIHVFT